MFRRRTAVVVVALVAMTAVSGCSHSTAPLEARAIEVVLPDTLTAPGSKVAVGQTVRVPGLAWSEDDAALGRGPAELGLTVTDISWPGRALLDTYENGDDFADVEPVVVAYQVDSPADHNYRGFMLGDPHGVLSDGRVADQLQVDFGIETGMPVGRDLDEACYRGEMPDPSTSELGCIILLVPDGQNLASLEWDALGLNESASFPADDPRAPYVAAPLVFDIPQP